MPSASRAAETREASSPASHRGSRRFSPTSGVRRWVSGWPRLLVFVCAASFVARLAVIFYFGTYETDYSTADIGTIPYNLIDGDGYTYQGRPSAYIGPGYTLLWAGMMEVFGTTGGQLAIQLLQALALSTLPLVWYRVSERIFGSSLVSLVSSVWLAIYPELLFLSATMYLDSVALFLWVLLLAALLRWRQTGGARLGATLGLLAGILVLTKGRMLVLVVATLLLFLIVDGRRSPARALRQYLVPVVCAALLMTPWVVRNWIQLDGFVLTESYLGYNLWIGHNVNANGTGKLRVGGGGLISADSLGLKEASGHYPEPPRLVAELRTAKTDPQVDRFYRRQAFRDIEKNPSREVGLTLRKIFYSWWRDPKSVFTKHPAYLLPWSFTLIFFVIGLAKSFVRPRRYLLVYLVCAVTTLLQVVFFVVPRFRLPVYPFVFGVAALGLVQLAEMVAARSARWRATYGAATVRLLQ